MSRYDGELRAVAEEPPGVGELLAVLRAAGHDEARARQEAIACYLSVGEGWSEAMKQLGGAFAPARQELKDCKAD